MITLGFSAVISQIVYMREFLNIFGGNELIFGIILANWMLLTALGAYIGKVSTRFASSNHWLVFFQVLSGIFPFITIFILRIFRNSVFPEGSMLNIIDGIIISGVLLFPFCVISGFLFTSFSIIFSRLKSQNAVSSVYFFDTLGSIIGGIIFSFILVYFFNTFTILYILVFANLLFSMLYAIIFKIRKAIIFILILISTFYLLVWFTNIETYTKQKLYPAQTILENKDTPYGNLVLTKTAEQLNFYENGMFLFSTNNIQECEEAVHYPMLQHSKPEKVLLVSGGYSGLAKEILKYPVKTIDYLEVNPALTDLAKKYTNNLESPIIKVIHEDARMFIKTTNQKYDVVIIALPEPSTAQLNRFYTLEFFEEIKKKMNANGIFSFALMSTADYISPEASEINSVMYVSLKKYFSNVIIIPGNKNYFIASDSPLNSGISKLVSLRKIENLYVNPYYLNDEQIAERVRYIMHKIDSKASFNEDFKPIGYYLHLKYWASHFKKNYYIFFGIVALLLAFIIIRLKPLNFCLFTGGFAASAFEVIILITFQIIYGYVYQMIGIIIMLFMAGLATGSLVINKQPRFYSVKYFLKIQFLLIVFSFALPFILLILNKSENIFFMVQGIFFLLIFIVGTLTGSLYTIASKISSGKIEHIASETYGADLMGSAIGALLLSAFLLPLLGIFEACFLIGIINIFSGIVLYRKKNNYLQ